MTKQYPNVIPEIEQWLPENKDKIMKFWIGADWHGWARFELFMFLERKFESSCLVIHSVPIWQSGDEEIDVLIDPRDNSMKPIAIKLRCEKVSENEGSFERFRQQMDDDMTRIKGLGAIESDFEDARLLLVGLSGEPPPPNDDSEFTTRPEPKHFNSGDLHCWIMEYSLAPREQNGGGLDQLPIRSILNE